MIKDKGNKFPIFRRAKLLWNKRGEEGADEPVSINLIFFILNLIFFVVLLYFVAKSGSGAVILEEKYAKQIALMLDAAKPGMEIQLDFGKDLEVAKANKISLEDMVKIDNEKNEVIVRFGQRGGYKYKFFTDVNVVLNIIQDKLVLTIT